MGLYKFHYFNHRGLGETVRYMFAYAGVEYAYVRWEWTDWEKEGRKKIEWGQLPVLTLPDGQTLTQYCAIFRYLGHKFGLVATDHLDSARCDEYVDCAWDFVRSDWAKYIMEEDKEKKAKVGEELLQTQLPRFLSKVNGYVQRHGGQWLVGNQLTWGDFLYAVLLEEFQDHLQDGNVLVSYPELKKIRNGMEELRGVKEWRLKRPVEIIE